MPCTCASVACGTLRGTLHCRRAQQIGCSSSAAQRRSRKQTSLPSRWGEQGHPHLHQQTRHSHILSLLKRMMDCLQANLTWHYALQALVPTCVFLTFESCVAQAVQGRLDFYPEHKGEGLHHVVRRDLPDSRWAPFSSRYSSLPQRSLRLQYMSQSSGKGRSAVCLGVSNIIWGCERQEVSCQPFHRR